jgi:hypothetical protein
MSHPLAFESIALDHLSLVTGGSGSPGKIDNPAAELPRLS